LNAYLSSWLFQIQPLFLFKYVHYSYLMHIEDISFEFCRWYLYQWELLDSRRSAILWILHLSCHRLHGRVCRHCYFFSLSILSSFFVSCRR
jgi:hypothetical protein